MAWAQGPECGGDFDPILEEATVSPLSASGPATSFSVIGRNVFSFVDGASPPETTDALQRKHSWNLEGDRSRFFASKEEYRTEMAMRAPHRLTRMLIDSMQAMSGKEGSHEVGEVFWVPSTHRRSFDFVYRTEPVQPVRDTTVSRCSRWTKNC
eukprot:Hpha_TRINITY_DN20602_c0_g1::TRINITY_DN20602_c0_g1_i1::g.148179::m.148179